MHPQARVLSLLVNKALVSVAAGSKELVAVHVDATNTLDSIIYIPCGSINRRRAAGLDHEDHGSLRFVAFVFGAADENPARL